MRKNALLALLVIAFAVPLAFGAGKQEPAKITVWGCFSELQAPLDKAVEVFKAKYPNVQVETMVFDLRDFEAKVAATAPRGQAADVIIMDHSLVGRYGKAGILSAAPSDVADMVNTAGRYLPIAKEKLTIDGKIVGLPVFGGGPALFYNKDYLAKAGIEPPKTVDELYKAAVKLRQMDAKGVLTQAGYSIRLTGPTGGSQKFAFVSNQMVGGDFIVEGKAPNTYHGNLDNEASAKALMWHVNLLHGADKSDDWALKHDTEGFAAGSLAMFMREPWVIPYMKQNAPNISYGVVPVPRDKHFRIYDWLVSACVPETGKNKKLAWEFAKVMQEKEVMEVLFNDSGWIPARRDLDFSDILAKEPRFKVFITNPADAEVYFEVNASAYTELWTKVGEIIQEAYRDGNLVNNLAGCRAAVKKANDAANQILKESGEYGE